MIEELVKRLRGEADIYGSYDVITQRMLTEAADAIEAQAAEIERLEAECFMLAAGACINPGQHALVGDEHGNFVCTAYEALQAEERAHADALAQIAYLMNELQAHKDALAQVKGSSDD